MDDHELRDRIRRLCAEGASTNGIARTLGVPRGKIAPLVRALAREQSEAAPEPAVLGCWVSSGWSLGLGVDADRDWRDRPEDGIEGSGLAAVLVAREARGGGASVCGYLVDTYCLGVKDALGPRVMSRAALRRFAGEFFAPFAGGGVEAPIGLARHLVWGAVAFARDLGFEPHRDLRAAAGHLGGRLDEPCGIRFGRNGRPYYMQGPFDDAPRILRTLERTVGRDNFHFTVSAEAFETV